MPEIVKAQSKTQLKAFLKLSSECGYSAGEAEYIARYMQIKRDRSAYYLALNDGKPCARLLSWYADPSPEHAELGRRGFFALLDGDRSAFAFLLSEMEKQQIEWGSKVIMGPVSPDLGGYFFGQCNKANTGQPKGDFSGVYDCGQTQALAEAGYTPVYTQDAFILTLPTENPYRRSAGIFTGRFGLKCQRARDSIFSDNLFSAVRDFSKDKGTAYLAQLQRLLPYIAMKHSFVVTNREGKSTGYAISLKGELPRVSTIITDEGAHRRPTALLLASALLDSYLKAGAKHVELSTIDERNEASLRLVRNNGAVFDRKYIVYNIKLT